MSVLQTHNQQIAERFNEEATTSLDTGASDLHIFSGMANHMDDCKSLMDTFAPGDMDRLCARDEGFYRFAKILENIALGLEPGDIRVPQRDHRMLNSPQRMKQQTKTQ